MRSTEDRLLDIRDAAKDLMDLTAGMDGAAFAALPDRDRIAYRGVKNALAELGEAIKALPPDIVQRNPTVDWRGFAGLRNIIVHQYFGVDMDRLWPVIRDEFPPLMDAVERELAALA